MNFLGIGAMELFVILIAALLIFGPGRLPELMGDAGRMLRDFRRATRDLTGDFEESYRDVRQTYEELETDMRRTAKELREDSEEIARSVNEVANEAIPTEDSKKTRRRSTSRQPSSAAQPSAKLDQAEPVEIDTVDAEDDTLQAEEPARLNAESQERPSERAPRQRKKPAQSAKDTERAKRAPAIAPDDDLLAVDSDEDLLGDDLLSTPAEPDPEPEKANTPQSED
ncbi:MAG: Sec-independent protein translocase subunit TatA/TatB [Chloroflexota bacterium]